MKNVFQESNSVYRRMELTTFEEISKMPESWMEDTKGATMDTQRWFPNYMGPCFCIVRMVILVCY